MKITYIFEQTHFDGTNETMSFSDCTPEEANNAARAWGWVPPRWWQWWRWNDGPRKPHELSAPTSENVWSRPETTKPRLTPGP